jgi:dTDP-4-dehydrorhamnose 3,5-epimerase
MSDSAIDGVIIRHLKKYLDNRGWLVELFRRDELSKTFYPAMSYISMTEPGVARGPHEHREQTDFFCFMGPSTFRLYLWDNRSMSPSFGMKCQFDFGADQMAAVIIPPGVVHAYKNIGSVDGLVFNAPDRLYAGEGKKETVDEIRYEDDSSTVFKIEP